MRNKFKKTITILTLALATTPALAYVTKDYASQRALFMQVEADLKKGKILSYRNHKQTLINYPLYPYLKYELLRSMIDQVKHSELSAFISTYHDSPLASKLQNEWLRQKAQRKLWADYLLGYNTEGKNDVEMQCYYIHSTLEVKHDKSVYSLVPDLWLTGKNQPKSCDPVFSAWKEDGKLSRNLIWQRIKLSIIENNVTLARSLAKDLPDSEKNMVELWIRTNNDPSVISKAHYFTSNHSAISEIIAHGLKKIAKSNPQQAVKLWKDLENQYSFNEHHWASVVKEIGLALSRKLDTHAEKWLATVPEHLQTKDVTDARLKVAVHNNDWKTISKIYPKLAPAEANSEKWQYWHARALEMLGDRDSSQLALNNLAQIRNYYGFLASARILQPYAMNHEAADLSDEVISSVEHLSPIVRAYELKQIGRIHTGKTEWVKALEGMNDQQRLAAAQIASNWQVPNWAIVALAKAANKNDLLLRFPQTYASFIHREAKHNDIDPAILFAITRQESAFIPTAKSPVGALGLMQIMPNTGKQIAKVSRETLKHPKDLLQPDRNIRFGSKYVRMMLNQNQQNPALAAASYNAGPHRVSKWMPEYDMPTDSWIETIPFKETREYVQNVLTYTVIYKQLLGGTPRLNTYMPIISGTKRNSKS